jgi:GNAT superfamily N-acetyltransferase
MDSDDYRCLVAIDSGLILGFYTLEFVSEGEYELAALFVDPAYIGTGIGRSYRRGCPPDRIQRIGKQAILIVPNDRSR